VERYIAAAVRADSAAESAYGYNVTRKSFFRAPTFALSILGHCTEFLSLEDHSRAIASEPLPPADPDTVVSTLRFLAEHGLLVSATEVRDHLVPKAPSGSTRNQPATGTNATTIPHIYIPTRNRPSTAAAAALSHLAHVPAESEVIIVDDSDQDTTPELLDALGDVGDDLRSRLFVMDRPQRRLLLDELVSETRPAEEAISAIRTCLGVDDRMPYRYGISRNWVLLASAGQRLVSADDDTLAQVIRNPGVPQELSVSSSEDPTELWTFADMEALGRSHSFEAANVVDFHSDAMNWLSPSSSVPEDRQVSIAGAGVDLVRRVMTNRCSVRATAFGLAGSPGRAGLQFLLYAEGARRDRFFENRRALDSALLAPVVIRRVPAPTVGNSSFFMTTHVGLDNRDILPPFFPLGRNSDAVFAQFLTTTTANALVAQIPGSIHHQRPEPLDANMDWIHRVAPSLSTFIGLIFQEFRPISQSEETRNALRRAGLFFHSVGELPIGDMADLFRLHWNRYLTEHADRLSYLLVRYDRSPGFWARHCDALLDNLADQLNSAGFPVPVELSHLPDFESMASRLGQLLRDFGILLYHWPEIWDTARQIKEGGKGVTRPLFR
jgi:hypothetical protein